MSAPQPTLKNQFLMTTVLALTQLVLLTFGTIFLKGMVNANGDITSSLYFQFLDKNWPWFFLFPLLGLCILKFPIRLIRVLLRQQLLASLR
jgi:hypothetical protein